MKLRVFIVLSLFFTSLVFSQNTAEKTDDNLVNIIQTQLNTSPSNNIEKVSNLTNNEVYITQIGDSNDSKVYTSSEASQINLLQNGNENSVFVIDNSLASYKKIEQLGKNNSVLDYSAPNLLNTSLEILQNGNDLKIDKFGTNSLVEKMKLVQQGTAKTLIIRSF